jgi:hypothetical protein
MSSERLATLLLIAILLIVPGMAVRAQQPSDSTPGDNLPESGREAAETSQADNPPGESRENNVSPDRPDVTFKPSEEISEDLSVPFPVDI